MSNLSTSVAKPAKFVFRVKVEVSTCEIFSISSFLAQFERSTLTLIFPAKLLNGLGNY